jgi:hypothetical protein
LERVNFIGGRQSLLKALEAVEKRGSEDGSMLDKAS